MPVDISAVLIGVPGGTSSRVSVTCPSSHVNDVALRSSTAEWSDNCRGVVYCYHLPCEAAGETGSPILEKDMSTSSPSPSDSDPLLTYPRHQNW